MWGIFAHVNLSRVLGQKGQLWPGSLTSSLIQNNFIIFFPQSPLSFPFKKNWVTHIPHGLLVTLTYLCSELCQQRRLKQVFKYTAHKFNLTSCSENAGQNNWTKSTHFEAAAPKNHSWKGRELPSNKNAPEPQLKCVSCTTPRGCTGWVLRKGGRLKALNLSFLSQLAFSSDPEREERGPCLIRRDDNLHPSQ